MQTGVLPPFVPFAQGFAAVLTAVLTGSLYYVAASPKGYFGHFSFYIFSFLCNFSFLTSFFLSLSDPTYVVAPVLQSRSGRQDLKKLFEGSIIFSHYSIQRQFISSLILSTPFSVCSLV